MMLTKGKGISRQLNILAVCQNYWPEPVNVHEVCAELAARGHRVTVLTGVPNYPTGDIPEDYRSHGNRRQVKDGVSIVRVGVIPRGSSLQGVRNKVRRALNYASFAMSGSRQARRMEGYDLVLVFQMSPISMVAPAAVAAKKNKVPLVVYAIDLWPEDLLTGGVKKNGLLYRLVKGYSRRLYGKASVIAVSSPDFISYIRDFLGLSGKRLEYLPQYAEDIFAVVGEGKPARKDGFDVVFAGNVGGNQALEGAISAMGQVPEASRARLHIYGSGSRLASCKARAEELGVQERVMFHGRVPVEEMPRVYRDADVMLLTLAKSSNGSLVPLYTIPRKLQSYLAAGKPVLVAADGIAAKLVREADCGLTCASEDCAGIAAAVGEFEGMEPDRLLAMGDNARSYYQKHFAKELFYQRLDAILEGVTA